ncbi:hypothetical protein FACS1894109_04510 [Spirochaetia bacterium]|nr:hypothetical protein FACS1894109_04510 [Spirochaetia bacterium]
MTAEHPLLSIIIPVYNLKPYLTRCIDSVIGQTYTNLDIIIVDDGSTDGSGAICDLYKQKDNRITVIHKPNGGLSDARNAGLDIVKGELIGFVDADDWIDTDMYALLVDNHIKTGADIVICGYYENKDIFFVHKQKKHPYFDENKILTKTEGINLLISDKEITSHVWNKLYTKKMFAECRYPVGKIYEDTYVMHNIFCNANNISVIKDYKYHYFFRKKSIVNRRKISDTIQSFDANYSRYNELKNNMNIDQKRLFLQMLNCTIRTFYKNPLMNTTYKKKLLDFIYKFKNNIALYYPSLSMRDKLFLKFPNMFFLCIYNPITRLLYDILYYFRQNKKNGH